MHRWISDKFPKLKVASVDINADLTGDCIQKFSDHYDELANTDILIIYNVVNEIDVKHAEKVWKNISYILKSCDKRLLVLLMEPCALKAVPRVDWLIKRLSECCKFVHQAFDETIPFTSPPTEIKFEGTGLGLNDRLFGLVRTGDASNPTLQTSIKRTHLAGVKDPYSPVNPEEVQKQLQQLQIRRGKGGRFASVRRKRAEGEQSHFSTLDPTFPI